MGEEANYLDDSSFDDLCELVSTQPSLKYFSINHNKISIECIEKLIPYIPDTMTAQFKQVTYIDRKYKGETCVTNHTKDELMSIKHSPLVYHIESVYRNAM
jgi:hypothetical protein